MNYVVAWSTVVDAGSPEEAAQEALRIQRDPDSIAVVFDVFNTRDNTDWGENLYFRDKVATIDLNQLSLD